MILIGKIDSPYVRRVALSMTFLGFEFERRDWSVGPDQARIREHNPLGRSPTLILDSGEVLVESGAMLDYFDELAGAEKALLPAKGEARRHALQYMALATGAAEKGLARVYEQSFRPAELRHQPWLDRVDGQRSDALKELDRRCAARAGQDWLIGNRMTQADITVACVYTFLNDCVGEQQFAKHYPALDARVARCEALPEFKAHRAPFFDPRQASSGA